MVRQEVNQALMSAVSKNFVISFFVRSVVPVVTETMLKTAGLIHQNVYEEIFGNTQCRHGTKNLAESSADAKRKGPDRSLDPLDIGGVFWRPHYQMDTLSMIILTFQSV